MNVSLLDLKAQYRQIKAEVTAAIEAVCEEQGFILGKRVADLEKSLADYVGAVHAVGVASGSDALLLALMAGGVGPGDEVLTVPFTFFATAGSISRLGARPVFVDIQRDTFNLDPERLAASITPKTKAVIPVHLFGQCADMEKINAIARPRGLIVIEDACQAIGAARHGRKAGTLGDAAAFSFFPSKNLGGFGDGGLITMHDAGMADLVSRLRVHGSRTRYEHDLVGINSRLDALQAAVLQVKLRYLDRWTEGRRRNAARYAERLKDAKLDGHVTVPVTAPGNHHVFNQYTIRAQRRDELKEYLRQKGIGSEIYYPLPLHLQACYKDLGYRKGAFPESERAAQEVLSLPVYAELAEDQLGYVVQTIRRFYTS